MHISEGLLVLEGAERGLRDLLAAAAGAGDYDAVALLTSWARALANMRAPIVASPASREEDQQPARSQNTRKKRAREKTHDYPRFFRRGDELVKIGWSKRDRKEYVHRTPKEVLNLVVDAVMKIGSLSKVFPAESIFSHIEKRGESVPAYQVYVSLAWLRGENLIEQHGRQGYSMTTDALKPVSQARWEQLPLLHTGTRAAENR